MALESKGWDRLPYHILVNICSYLRISERNCFARTCKAFSEILNSRHIWKRFKFCFRYPSDERFLQGVEKYGQYMEHVYVEIDQSETQNRENAVELLKGISSVKQRRLKCLSIRFTGENPCFYSGKEFLDVLDTLLGPTPDGHMKICPLLKLDLGEMSVTLDDRFLDNLSDNNPRLQHLNIENKVLVCKVSPPAVLRLAQRCHFLQELHLFCCSLTDEVLLEFTQRVCGPLERLSIMCRGRDRATKTIKSETWRALTDHLPNLRVSLSFDHTCSTEWVADVMKPDIPVSDLVMETYTYIYDEVNQAAKCYSETLEKFVLHTPISRNSPELQRALIQLASDCQNLKVMHVYCVLDTSTVNKILDLKPAMKEQGNHTLRDAPWPVSYTIERAQSDIW